MPALKPTEQPTDEFEAATEAYREAKAKWTEIESRLDAISAALVWSKANEAERESDRMDWARQRVKTAFADGIPREHRLAVMLVDAQDERDDYKPKWTAAQGAWAVARRQQTSKIAKELAPRQAAVVQVIAKLLERLSDAILEEQEIRQELVRMAPEAKSAFLPNCSSDLTGTLSDWRSPASQWTRRMRKIGILQ